MKQSPRLQTIVGSGLVLLVSHYAFADNKTPYGDFQKRDIMEEVMKHLEPEETASLARASRPFKNAAKELNRINQHHNAIHKTATDYIQNFNQKVPEQRRVPLANNISEEIYHLSEAPSVENASEQERTFPLNPSDRLSSFFIRNLNFFPDIFRNFGDAQQPKVGLTLKAIQKLYGRRIRSIESQPFMPFIDNLIIHFKDKSTLTVRWNADNQAGFSEPSLVDGVKTRTVIDYDKFFNAYGSRVLFHFQKDGAFLKFSLDLTPAEVEAQKVADKKDKELLLDYENPWPARAAKPGVQALPAKQNE